LKKQTVLGRVGGAQRTAIKMRNRMAQGSCLGSTTIGGRGGRGACLACEADIPAGGRGIPCAGTTTRFIGLASEARSTTPTDDSLTFPSSAVGW